MAYLLRKKCLLRLNYPSTTFAAKVVELSSTFNWPFLINFAKINFYISHFDQTLTVDFIEVLFQTVDVSNSRSNKMFSIDVHNVQHYLIVTIVDLRCKKKKNHALIFQFFSESKLLQFVIFLTFCGNRIQNASKVSFLLNIVLA